MALDVRKDLVEDPKEQEAFKAKYNMKLPSTFEDDDNFDADDYEKVMESSTRPDKGLWGGAWQYSRVYDFCTCPSFSVMWSSGGQIWGPQDRAGRGRPQHRRQREGDGAATSPGSNTCREARPTTASRKRSTSSLKAKLRLAPNGPRSPGDD